MRRGCRRRRSPQLFKRLDAEDLAARTAETWEALALCLLDFLRVRRPGTPSVRVFNPNQQDHGWDSTHTVIEIVTDDAPFLVSSVAITISEAGLPLHTVIHPVYNVERDPGGQPLRGADGGQRQGRIGDARRSRPFDRAGGTGTPERDVRGSLQDVTHCVNDWAAMRDKMLSIANEMPRQKIPLAPEGVAEAQEFLRWVANDHFTFLGYRKYRVGKSGGEDVLQADEESGLGILRQGERSVAPRSLKSLAARDLPQSGSMDAVILTKTNARATVHRPGHMDYIGVLEFDDKGAPVVEHRFLGLYASGAYTRRPWDIPLVRQKYEAVMDRSGLRRDSHSGKALRNILETLPRDELFQASEDELFAISTGILQLQGRARSRVFVRADKFGRFFSCLVFIPRDHITSDVRERIENLLKRTFRGERIDSTIRSANRHWPACT